MNVQSYVVHGSPAFGMYANTRIGGEPLLACHQQDHFNTLIDLRVEIVLAAVAIVVFAVQTLSGRSAWRCVRHPGRDRLSILLLLIPFLALALLETAYFIQNMRIVGTTVTRLIMLALFADPIGGTLLVIMNLFKR